MGLLDPLGLANAWGQPSDYYREAQWQMREALCRQQQSMLDRFRVPSYRVPAEWVSESKPKPKTYREELQAEIDEWLK